ncbi:MAG: exopolysaccharide biosynthesis polyprenyl glycosylphosphotransferase [Flavobacterium sp.]
MIKNKGIHFEISERKILLRVFDVFFVLGALYFVGIIFDFSYFEINSVNFYWTIVLSLYLLTIGSVFEMYHLQVASSEYQVIRSIVLTSVITVLAYLLTPLFTPPLPSNRIQILFFFLSILIALLLWRIFYAKYLASHRFEKKVILICDDHELEELRNDLSGIDPHYKILGFVNVSVRNTKLKKSISDQVISVNEMETFAKSNKVSEIVIAAQNTEGLTAELYNKLLFLLESGFVIREYTHVYESMTQRIPVHYVSRDFYKYFPFSRSNQNQLYLWTVRLLELIVSFIGILAGFLILPFILIGNFFGNRGKLFYTQERVGRNGKVFRIVKFRTMVKNAEDQGAVFASVNDTRVTKFGKFLRKTRLDEVPQFINILLGEMAVIGPRPERPVFVNQIAEQMPFYQTRHVIKPGLTGWAQVNYPYGDSFEDSLMKLQYDLYYIKHRSIFLDLNIIIKTLSTVLFFRGQ